LARNATLNLATEGWIFLVLLVAMPKLVLFLGDTQFGLFSLAWVVIGYLAFLDVGVNRVDPAEPLVRTQHGAKDSLHQQDRHGEANGVKSEARLILQIGRNFEYRMDQIGGCHNHR